MRNSGIEDWQNFGDQSHRRLLCTKLANDPNVNISTSMSAARHESVGAHATCVQASSGRTTAVRAIRNLSAAPTKIVQQRASMPALNHRVSPTPATIVQKRVSPVLGMSVTQQVSFLDNYLDRCTPPVAPSNTSNCLAGHVVSHQMMNYLKFMVIILPLMCC